MSNLIWETGGGVKGRQRREGGGAEGNDKAFFLF